MAGKNGELTNKQKRFVEEYLIDLNATQAAIRAGYSEKTAPQEASRLLTNVKIQSKVAEAQVNRSKRTEITQDRVLQELARIGFSDLRNVITPGGHLLNTQDWDDDTAASIASIEVVTNAKGEKDEDGCSVVEYTHKIKVWDKNSALEKIAKHLGMFTERVHLTSEIQNMTDDQIEKRIATLTEQQRIVGIAGGKTTTH
ncbi:MAG: terminase small subunit [Planctomycetes bacterium]|nr:terminase small subunit [Planctomycetota bacterium]